MEEVREIDSSKIHFSQFTYSFPPQKIACGIHHSICISNLATSSSFFSDQSAVVLGWGRNVYNVVGLGEDHWVASVPTKLDCVEFEKGDGIYEVSCGHSHSLFLRKSRHGPGGEVYGSGLGNRGRQGFPNPHADADDTPEVEDIWFMEGPKHIPISSVPIARIVCGADHSLALDLNGVLWAWGMNGDGQCGVGHQRDVLAPEPTVLPKMKGSKVLVAHMAAGSRHSMLVTAKDGSMGSTAGGKVFVWGCNSDGRLGLGHDRTEPLPVIVDALSNHKMVLVAAGEAHSGAVDMNGSLYMWGLGSYGRLGLGEVMDVPLARRVPLPDDPHVSELALGSFHSVALAGRTQSLYTWGYGEALGNKVGGGISLSPLVVVLEDTKSQVLQIAAGPYHTLVLMEDGELITFGQGASGRLGTGNSKNYKLPVSLGSHGFATKLKHTETGEKTSTQKRSLEHPSEKSLKRSAAASSQPSGKQSWEIAKVDCGDMFTCAVTWHGALYTWGCGARGQLGTGSLQDSWVPKVVRMPSGRLVKSMACGKEHCIVVTYDGNAYAWGKGDKGQLGVGRNEDTASPKVVEIHNVLSVAAGEDHSGAICRGEDDNELWMWGASELGKLGLGEVTSSDSVPVAIRSFAKSDNPYKVPVALSCGQYHTAVICVRGLDSEEERIAGRVWTFGGGWFGRLGHNDMENQYDPKIVNSLVTRIRTIHCGSYHTCGLSYEKGVFNDNGELAGDLWVWGRNRCICEHEHAKVPIKFMQIDGQPKITCVATSEVTTMLVTSAGLVYAWGDNRNGQIGLEGGKKESPQPEIIRNLPQPPILMGAGPAHMVVYARNKAMFAWGNQSCGRLGLQEKKMEKVIFKPRLVRAEWGSIEAMSGADDEDTAGGDAQKKVTASALATIGEGRPAEDGGSDGEGSSSAGDQDSVEEDKTKENMLHAMTSGQKVQRFSTMQMMLKEEPESNKISSLHKHEKELKKVVESSVHNLAIVVEKERRLSILEDRVQRGIVHLNDILHGPVPKSSEEDRLDHEIKSKLSTYEELFSVLQLQVSYLATLSMTIKDEVSAEVFVDVVCAIFADLHDSRIRNLFILLLQLMTTKELESAKNIDDVFQTSSRVFRLFSFFALHRFHYEVVVHPVMDCHKMDDQGQPVTLMGAVTFKSLEKAQTWALDFNRYLESPSIAAKLKEQASQELRADFQKELDAFVDFFKVEVVAFLNRFALSRSFWSFFAFCRESIRECQLVSLEDESSGTEVELKVVEPIFRLFVNGIMLPLLRAPKKYGGKEVGLSYCEKNNFDGDVLFNVCTVLDAFQSMTESTKGDTGKQKESHKRLSKIGSRLKPEILRFLLDRTISVDVAGRDDPDTTVTVQSFLCHYDRTFRSIYVPPSRLLLFQNLVLTNVNKIRLQSGDRLEEACRKIGWWSEPLVKEATEKAEKNMEVLYRLTLQHRFLFTEGSMALCPASKCTVPLCLSAAAGSDALARRQGNEVNLVQNVDVVRTLKEDNANKVLEDLFRMLPPLKSSNFVGLKEELEALWTQCSAGQNDALTEKLAEGVQAVADFIETELSPEEVLDAMGSVILLRNRHSRYLHSMLVGLSRLPMEENRHGKEIRSAELELKAVIEHSKQMLLPERITEVAKLEAAILKGSDLNFLIKKQAARVKTKPTKKVMRYNLLELLSDGKVLECYSDLDTVQGKVYLTMWAVDADIIVHVGLLEEGDAMLEFVKQFRIPGDVIKQLPFADREDTTGLPVEGPTIMKWRSLELLKVLKEVPPAD